VRDPLSAHIVKSRLAKPRNELSVYMGFGVSAPGKPRCETPCLRTSRNPDLRNPEMSLVYIWASEFRLPGNPGARPLVCAHREIPVCETPKRCSVKGFRRFGTWETKGYEPLVFASCEIPVREIPVGEIPEAA
jgi:hypothetical protein